MILEESTDMLGSYQHSSYDEDTALKSEVQETKNGPMITYNGEALETITTGKKDSSSGIVMSAFVPEIGGRVFHRRFGSGKQGFHFGDGADIPAKHKILLQITF